jgi:hypothetical protein
MRSGKIVGLFCVVVLGALLCGSATRELLSLHLQAA